MQLSVVSATLHFKGLVEHMGIVGGVVTCHQCAELVKPLFVQTRGG